MRPTIYTSKQWVRQIIHVYFLPKTKTRKGQSFLHYPTNVDLALSLQMPTKSEHSLQKGEASFHRTLN